MLEAADDCLGGLDRLLEPVGERLEAYVYVVGKRVDAEVELVDVGLDARAQVSEFGVEESVDFRNRGQCGGAVGGGRMRKRVDTGYARKGPAVVCCSSSG